MKTKTISPTTNQDQFQSLEDHLTDTMKLNAKADALSGKVFTVQIFKTVVIESVQVQVQKEIDKSHTALNPFTKKAIAQHAQKETAQKAELAIKEVHSLTENQLPIKRQIDSSHVSKWDVWNHRIGRMIIISFGLVEGFFLFQSLIYNGTYMMISVTIGLILAIGFVFLTEAKAKLLYAIENVWKRILIGFLMSIPVFIGLYCIGQFRVAGYESYRTIQVSLGNADLQTEVMSAITLAGISYLIYVLGLIISLKFYLNPEQKNSLNKYKKLTVQHFEIENIKEEIQSHINQCQAEADKLSEEALKAWEEAVLNERRLVSIAQSARQTYINTYSKYATTILPEYLTNPPCFQFTLYVSLINNQNHDSKIQ